MGDHSLQETSKAIGDAECESVLGAALGDTIDVFQGSFGLGLDCLVPVRLATASGDLIEVSETQQPELFGGISGAGANFGIVTSATFRVDDAPNNGRITSIDFLYPGSLKGSVWEVQKSFGDDLPSEMAPIFALFTNQTTGQIVIIANAVYFRPLDEAKQLVACAPLQTAFFGQGNSSDSPECAPGQWSNKYSIGLKQIDVPTLVSFFNCVHELYSQHRSMNGVVHIDLFENYLTNTSLLKPLYEFTQAARA
ncbi:hypothetical protein BDV11DRAFT_170137 [Aspergillus similis]